MNQKFKYVLVMDCETTGLFKGENPVICPKTHKEYQSVSWGFLVVDFETLEIIDKLYVIIKWNGKSEWDFEAQKIHGMSKEYLNEHGFDEKEAVEIIGSFLEKYWGPYEVVEGKTRTYAKFPSTHMHLMGINVMSFDVHFLNHLFKRVLGEDIILNISHRHIDLNSVGLLTLGTYTSDELFDAVGLEKRGIHNALEDVKMTLDAARRIKLLWKTFVK